MSPFPSTPDESHATIVHLQAKLEQHEFLFGELTKNMHEVFYVSSLRDDRMIYISPGYESIWGRTCQSLYDNPHSFIDAVHPADRERVLASLARQAQGVATAVEYRILLPSGEERWILDRANPKRDASGNVTHVTGIAEDITEIHTVQVRLREHAGILERRVRKRTQELVRKNKDLMSLLDEYRESGEILRQRAMMLDLINDAVLIIDTDMIVSYWNAAAERLYKVRQDEAIGMHLNDIFEIEFPDPEDYAGMYRDLNSVGRWLGQSWHILRKTGERIPIESSLSAEFDSQGALVRVIAAARSIADRIRGEAELRHSRDELSAANAALSRTSRLKDEFLANMSHELRTPLTTIQILSEALGEQLYGPLNERQIRAVGTIGESGRHLLALINDILDLSKIEAGQLQLAFDTCDSAVISTEAIEFVHHQAERRRITVEVDLPEAPVHFMADPLRVKQILMNLLSNAVKFTPEGGRIGLRVREEADADAVRFVVWDSGIGIDPDQLHNLFRPFIQLDGGTSRSYPGTGLGLSLVHRMVDLHGGRVEVESRPGEGSRFSVVFPAWRQHKPPLLLEQAAAEQPGDGSASMTNLRIGAPRILLVDDNDATLTSLGEYLKLKQMEVLTARSGSDALSRLERESVDVVLMDVQMPGMSGLEAIARIRASQNPHVRSVRIITLTALAMAGDRDRCIAAGANEYMSKPVHLAQLVALITQQLEEAAAGSAAGR